MVARLGGEEFLVVLTDSPAEVVAQVAKRLCAAVAERPFLLEAGAVAVNLTISVGGTLSEPEGETPEAILRRSDEALYEAKRRGRNRVVLDFEADTGSAVTSAWL
jgi:two-component system cell cycle response regulator